jgi:hypothetical protein
MGLIKTNFNDFLNEAVSAGEKKVAAFVTKTAKEYGYSEADAVFFIKSTIEKLGLGVDESLEIYESMSDLDLIAKDSKNFKDFVKQAKKEYPLLAKGDSDDLEDWLESVYDDAIEESSIKLIDFNLKPGVILNFKDGETWKVTKVIGNANNPRGILATPYGDTKDNYISNAIEFTMDQLKSDLEISEATDSNSSVVSEKKITIKRQYTDANPAVTVGHHARIRNKVIEALKDGQITQEEFDTILKEMTSDSSRWMKRNSHYFNVSEDGITLSKTGSSILKGILTEKTTKNPEIWVPGGFDKEISKYPNSKITKEIVKNAAKKWEVKENDAISYVEYAWTLDLKENIKTNMKTNFIYESFSDFEKSLNESPEVNESSEVNEAAYVPSNILEFAKEKGSYATKIVKSVATWAEKAGKRISGGTAIGKNYNTIVLDMKNQGAEIYINLEKETIELYNEEVTDAKSFKRVLDDKTNESSEVNDNL